MADGIVMSPEFAKQVVQTVQQSRRAQHQKTVETDYDKQQRLAATRFPPKAVILDAALPAASHSLTGATSCLATVCRWSVEDEEYVETDEQITVWNHSETIDHAVDTFGSAKFQDGHYWFWGDCEAMADRGGA